MQLLDKTACQISWKMHACKDCSQGGSTCYWLQLWKTLLTLLENDNGNVLFTDIKSFHGVSVNPKAFKHVGVFWKMWERNLA